MQTRRGFMSRAVATGAALGTTAIPVRVKAQAKPDKLVFVGDNGMWHDCLVKEVAPAFEKETGIRIDFTALPVDATAARLRSELTAGGTGIDIVQWTAAWAGWLTPYLEDHDKLLAKTASRHPDFDWDDFLPAIREMATWDGKLSGIPYRVTTGILHYQKALLQQAGVAKLPETFAELQEAAIACTEAGAPANRYGLGYIARQGPAMLDSWCAFLRSSGGDFYDPKTWEIRINEPAAVESLQYYGDLLTKYHAVVPDSLTWEFNETIAAGQNDRFAMVQTLAPYGSLFNNSSNSKTAGKWAWSVIPGAKSPQQSRSYFGGWSLAVPKSGKNQEWAFEFIQMACSKKWMRRSMELDNAPPRVSVLNDPGMVERFGWAPVAAVALKTALLDPREAIWPTLDLQLRAGISSVLLGQRDAKSALDQVASDWLRSLRRAGLK
jgi:ABC-type glycerol-3-phosphate transport system substrate-binding protein